MTAMQGEIFYWVFNMSITASVTGVFVMLVRRTRRIPGRLMVLLWLAPFLRMICPLGLNSPYSLMSLLSQITTKTIVVYRPVEELSLSMMNSILAADAYFPMTYKTNVLKSIFEVAGAIWIIVSLALLLMMFALYFTTIRELRDSVHLRDNVYFSEKLVSPAVYGMVKPRIVIPAAYRDGSLDLILWHEKIHIQCLDNLWRMLAFVIAAFHWFNPLCLIFLKQLLADIELACDERVLAAIGADRARDYASALLACRQGSSVFASAFGGAKIRVRIENILSFKRLTGFSLTVFAVLLGIIFYVLLTNAV